MIEQGGVMMKSLRKALKNRPKPLQNLVKGIAGQTPRLEGPHSLRDFFEDYEIDYSHFKDVIEEEVGDIKSMERTFKYKVKYYMCNNVIGRCCF